jgi:hypothetical protein
MYRRRAAIAPQGSRAVLVRVEPPKAAVQLAEHFSDKLLDLSHGMACRNPRFLQYVKKTTRPNPQILPACGPPTICDRKLNHQTITMVMGFSENC